MSKLIPAKQVTRVAQPALVAADADPTGQPITVIPLIDGAEIAGLEIRCHCGSHVVVDCVFDSDPSPEAPPPEEA